MVVVWVVEDEFISAWWIGVDLFFVLGVESHLVSASGFKLTAFLCRGIEIDMIVEWRSKLS